MAIARGLRRYFGGIVLGLLGAIVYFQVRGAIELPGAALRGGAHSIGTTKAPHDGQPASEPKKAQSARLTPPPPIAGAATASDGARNLDRSALEGGGINPLSGLRVVPELRDGKVIGLRLFGIRPGSLLGTLGLKNGDRLEAINGFDLTSPEKALEAYARLRTAKRLSVQLDRVGKPVTIDLNIN